MPPTKPRPTGRKMPFHSRTTKGYSVSDTEDLCFGGFRHRIQYYTKLFLRENTPEAKGALTERRAIWWQAIKAMLLSLVTILLLHLIQTRWYFRRKVTLVSVGTGEQVGCSYLYKSAYICQIVCHKMNREHYPESRENGPTRGHQPQSTRYQPGWSPERQPLESAEWKR